MPQPGEESAWSHKEWEGEVARPTGSGGVGLADFVRRMNLLASAVRRCPQVV